MRKILLLITLCLSLAASDFHVGAKILNVQDSEGDGIEFLYQVSDNYAVSASLNRAYVRGRKSASKSVTWNQYEFYRVGVQRVLGRYADNKIETFIDLGFEHLVENSEISTDDSKLDTYILAGAKFDILESDNLYLMFAFGSSGKGATADKLVEKNDYAHGFNSVLALFYKF